MTLMLKHVNQVNQILLKALVEPSMICVDATLGNGHDLVFLLQLLKGSGFVYGFDIQGQAITNTYQRIKESPYENYKLIEANHAHIKAHILERLDIVVFNLGYLPGVNKHITTELNTTVTAIRDSFDLLKVGGKLVITVYPGHVQGQVEAEYLSEWFNGLCQHTADVLHYHFINQMNHPPYTYIVEKKQEHRI